MIKKSVDKVKTNLSTLQKLPAGSFFSFQYFRYAPDLSILQTHFDSVRVKAGIRQQIFDDPLCLHAAPLILLQYDRHTQSRFNVRPVLPVHLTTLSVSFSVTQSPSAEGSRQA